MIGNVPVQRSAQELQQEAKALASTVTTEELEEFKVSDSDSHTGTPRWKEPRPLKSWEPDEPVCDPKAAG